MKVKTKRKICGYVGAAGIAAVFFAVGGMECFQMSVKTGIITSAIGLIIGAAALWKGGYLLK